MTVLLQPNNYYHIYNHAVGKENLFLKEENYSFFLRKYAHYIFPIADTFAYCIMPNHFHFAIRIKSESELFAFYGLDLSGFENLTGLLSKQFSNLFNSYSKAFNKQQNRQGNLFQRPFNRKQIEDDNYFKRLIHYIHFNPVHHGFVKDLRDWKHSSFESFFSDKPTKLARDKVIEWFSDKDGFYQFHKDNIDEKMALELEFI